MWPWFARTGRHTKASPSPHRQRVDADLISALAEKTATLSRSLKRVEGNAETDKAAATQWVRELLERTADDGATIRDLTARLRDAEATSDDLRNDLTVAKNEVRATLSARRLDSAEAARCEIAAALQLSELTAAEAGMAAATAAAARERDVLALELDLALKAAAAAADADACVVCCAVPCAMIAQPCCHFAVCAGCAPACAQCPVCREVADWRTVYRP
jgi:hypothetical protein